MYKEKQTTSPPAYQNIVFLTGAGISAPSGLDTFRGKNSIWNKYPPDEVATAEAFERNPERVHAFINGLKAAFQKAKPNEAHKAISLLQQSSKADISVLTQNIDTLHEQANSKNVYHIHGQINQIKCLSCGCITEEWGSVNSQTICPSCNSLGKMRPNIVLFHEPILWTEKVEKLLETVDLFVAVGTSGIVFPAAGFAKIAKTNGAETVLLNAETIENSDFDEIIIGNAAETLPKFVSELLHSGKV